MNFKTLFYIAVSVVVTWLVFSITSNKKNVLSLKSEPSPAVTNNASGGGEDHHGGSSTVDSAVFDGLTGKKAPDFTLESYDDKKISLANLRGKNVVLFFSEGLMCYPACWDQISAFGKDTRFSDENIVVLTIVNDKKNEWKDAVDKMPELAKTTVLFDTDKAVSNAYGVLALPSSMHRGQLAGHSYVVVDKTGIVRLAKDDTQMAIRNEALISDIAKL